MHVPHQLRSTLRCNPADLLYQIISPGQQLYQVATRAYATQRMLPHQIQCAAIRISIYSSHSTHYIYGPVQHHTTSCDMLYMAPASCCTHQPLIIQHHVVRLGGGCWVEEGTHVCVLRKELHAKLMCFG